MLNHSILVPKKSSSFLKFKSLLDFSSLPSSLFFHFPTHIPSPNPYPFFLGTLTDFQVRDLNDEINKLLREKRHWEKQIKALGGPNHFLSTSTKSLDSEGKEVPGNRGYKYFGRAKDLPGVKELFEDPNLENGGIGVGPGGRWGKLKTRGELFKNVDADYFGFRDEDDGRLLTFEREITKTLLAQAQAEDQVNGIYMEAKGMDLGEVEEEAGAESTNVDEDLDLQTRGRFQVGRIPHSDVPSQKEIEIWLVNKRKEVRSESMGQVRGMNLNSSPLPPTSILFLFFFILSSPIRNSYESTSLNTFYF